MTPERLYTRGKNDGFLGNSYTFPDNPHYMNGYYFGMGVKDTVNLELSIYSAGKTLNEQMKSYEDGFHAGFLERMWYGNIVQVGMSPLT